jgi:hypothetical protein
MLSALDGDGPVGVDLGDRVGTGGARTDLGGILDPEEHLLAWLVVEGVALQVGAAELLVDEELRMSARSARNGMLRIMSRWKAMMLGEVRRARLTEARRA